MLGGRIRNGKPRIFVFVFVGVVMLLGIFVLRDTHIKLNDARSTVQRCEQQQESLSAQLQVVYEHKSRLEKSLQQEKTLHKKSNDEILAQYQELQDVKEKEKQEAGNRFNSVQQQHKMLQIQNEDLQDELNKAQQANIRLMEDKQKLQDSLDESDDLVKQKDLTNSDLKAKILTLQQEIDFLSKDVSDKDSKLKELALHVNLCDAKLDALRLNKFSVNSDPEVTKKEKGVKIVDGEHKLISKGINPEHVESKRSATKIDTTKDSVLKIGNLNKKNDFVHSVVLSPQSANQEDIVPHSEYSNQPKNYNNQLPADKSNYQDLQNGPISPNALPMGMGRRKGFLGPANQQLELPNNIPFPEESLGAAQQLAIPDTRNLNQKNYERDDGGAKIPVGRVEEFQGNGLEQQENGGDQDLDNMEENGAGGAPPKEEKDDGKAFDDTDFDQVADDGGDALKKAEYKQDDGVAVAPP